MADKDLGRSISVGVGLKESEVAEFDRLAGMLGFTRNAIMAWALRHFLREHKAGRITVPVREEVTRTLGEP